MFTYRRRLDKNLHARQFRHKVRVCVRLLWDLVNGRRICGTASHSCRSTPCRCVAAKTKNFRILFGVSILNVSTTFWNFQPNTSNFFFFFFFFLEPQKINIKTVLNSMLTLESYCLPVVSFLFLWVCHLRLSQREDDPVVGWLTHFIVLTLYQNQHYTILSTPG